MLTPIARLRQTVRNGVITFTISVGCHSPSTTAFQKGGIVEFFDGPEGAGRYFAKECSKREQKVLPERYAAGLGRWWWLAPRWQPQCRASHQISLAHWPYEQPVKHIWNSEQIAGCERIEPAKGRVYVVARDRRSNLKTAPAGEQFELPGIPRSKRFSVSID